MSKYRRAAKIDNNQNAIVSALRDMPGVTVEVGHDDILVGHKGKNYWYEIKSDRATSKKTGKVLDSAKKEGQIKLENGWAGHYRIVSGLDEILEEINAKLRGPQ